MKKIIAITLSLVMLFVSCAMAQDDTKLIEIGTSGLEFFAPDTYEAAEITAEDTDESQVAYYASEANLVDFDLYQWAKAEGEALAEVAAAEAAEYGAEAVAVTCNDIPAYFYAAEEESDGVVYTTNTYMFENGAFFAEIVFWMDGENAEETVQCMLDTMTIASVSTIDEGGNVIELGTTAYSITMPYNYVLGEITSTDTDESQVAYYYSDDCLVDFDVYQWTIAEGETLADVAAAEAAEYGAQAAELHVGESTIYLYEATEESEGIEFTTLTVLMQDGDQFVEVVFWLDGENAGEIVSAALMTITK